MGGGRNVEMSISRPSMLPFKSKTSCSGGRRAVFAEELIEMMPHVLPNKKIKMIQIRQSTIR